MQALAAATLLVSTMGAGGDPPALDFETLSVRYSVYPSLDDAIDLVRTAIPAGTALPDARERLVREGMSCRPRSATELVCRYSASVVVDGVYIRPILWLATFRSDGAVVTTVGLAAD